MRRLILMAALLTTLAAHAQEPRRDLQPLPEPPPPPPGMADDASQEPQVTITRRGEDVVEEFRLNGRLYMLKVTPPHGRPYYMVDTRGDGQYTRMDNLDSGVRVPQWVIKEF